MNDQGLPSSANLNCGSKLNRLLPIEGSNMIAGLPSEKEGINENPFWVTLNALLKNNVLSRCPKQVCDENQIKILSRRLTFFQHCIVQS